MGEEFDPETAGNAAEIEMQFAVQTVEHLEVSSLAGRGGNAKLMASRPTKSSSPLYHPGNSS